VSFLHLPLPPSWAQLGSLSSLQKTTIKMNAGLWEQKTTVLAASWIKALPECQICKRRWQSYECYKVTLLNSMIFISGFLIPEG
jgi:hypothetical protein